MKNRNLEIAIIQNRIGTIERTGMKIKFAWLESFVSSIS